MSGKIMSIGARKRVDFFRISQEALNNITRHAGVRQALVRLNQESPIASLEIVDEGCGFDVTASNQMGGFGLAGMSARASEINWDLAINSQPGKGTQIKVIEQPV